MQKNVCNIIQYDVLYNDILINLSLLLTADLVPIFTPDWNTAFSNNWHVTKFCFSQSVFLFSKVLIRAGFPPVKLDWRQIGNLLQRFAQVTNVATGRDPYSSTRVVNVPLVGLGQAVRPLHVRKIYEEKTSSKCGWLTSGCLFVSGHPGGKT